MRRANWPRLLAEALAAAKDTPFAWGSHDCALFAADVVLAITGADHGAVFRGRYRTANGAARALKKQGFAGLPDYLDSIFTRRPVSYARRGDVVLYDGAMGICDGGTSWFVTADGLTPIPTLTCETAWGVD